MRTLFFIIMFAFGVCCGLAFSQLNIANAMFSVRNNTDKDDYKKYINNISKKYNVDGTYMSSFKVRVTNEKGNDDLYWMDKVGKNYNKIEVPYYEKTSSPSLFQSFSTNSSHLTAYITGMFYTETQDGIKTANPCYIGFSELTLPENEDVKRVRVIFNGLNDNYEPLFDFEVNEKHNIMNPQRSLSFVSELNPYKNVIMK